MIKLIQGNCLDKMKDIESGSVDMILTDPPYGTTACKWDSIIPLEPMWEQLKRIIKPNGVIALFGSEPFSSALRMSNIKQYKYDWIWNKTRGFNFAHAKKRPMQAHEYISIYYKKQPTYHPQMTESNDSRNRQGFEYNQENAVYGVSSGKSKASDDYNSKERYPLSIQAFKKNWRPQDQHHKTQKPVALLEYLIKTYTNEGETVLDFTFGSGSAAIACLNTNRNFIGIEMDQGYFDIAEKRIAEYLNDKVER